MCARELAGSSACSAQQGTPNLSRNRRRRTAASGSFTNTSVLRRHTPRRSKDMHVRSLSFAATSNARCAMSGPPSFFSSPPSFFSSSSAFVADTSSRTGCCSTSASSLASSSPAVAERSMHCTPFSHASTTFLMSSSYPKLKSRSASSSTSSSRPAFNAPVGKRFSRTHSAARAGVAMRISGGAPANSRSTAEAHPAAGSSPARREGAHFPRRNAASFFT
mmetsp:Transcript_4278/g.17040  ORF Transcript_4278/g.17040 Transcript_4278/m.17040 type:complete len:220 (+) Transcript_4278:2246-2905(+)